MTTRFLAALALLAVAGCASSTLSGQGSRYRPSAATSSAATGGSGGLRGAPSSTSAGTSSGTSAAGGPSSSAHGTPLTVTGLVTHRSYAVQVWAQDHLTDCAAHAYGGPMLRFLRAHDCTSATRRLLTLDLDGSAVAMSTITVTLPPYQGGTAADVYTYAGRFAQLENADGTGSMNDLLREGTRVPGVQDAIPAGEAFLVESQDLVVTIFDAWYAHSATPDQDATLLALERDLYLTPVTSDP